MANGKYLRRRPQGWVFRRAIPQDLQARFGSCEIVRSLAKLPQNRAAFESRALGAACEELFMEARADITLTSEQLRGFADAFGVSKRDKLSRWTPPLRMRGDDPQEDYEDYRDVAIAALEAARDGREIFDKERVLSFADEAGIPRETAELHMPMLQRAIAHGTAAYTIDLAKKLRPSPRPQSRLSTMFWGPKVDAADVRFDTLVSMFEVHRGTFGRPAPSKAPRVAAQLDPDPSPASVCTQQESPEIAADMSLEANRGVPIAGAPWLGAAAVVDEVEAETPGRVATDGARPYLEGTTPELVSATAPMAVEIAPTLNQVVPAIAAKPRATPAGHEPAAQSLGQERGAAAGRPLAPTAASPDATSLPGEEWDGRLSTAWQTIVDAKINMGEWRNSRRPELAGTLRIFMRLLGDVSILTLTRDEASEFRRKYFMLPRDHKNLWFDRENGRDRTYDEMMAFIARVEATQGVKIGKVVSKTWNKQRSTLTSAIIWLKANRELAKNIEDPFGGLHIRIPKTVEAIRLERNMATTASLKALFRTEYWTGRRDRYHLFGKGGVIVRDSLYWVPIFEVCLGLRREEVCQLRGRHLRRKFGILGIDLFAEDIEVKESDGASRRWVPLSQPMLDVGVVECLILNRDPEQLLFPELSNDNAHGKYGVSFGKRFLYYVRNVKPDLRDIAEELCSQANVPVEDRPALIERELQYLIIDFKNNITSHACRHWFKTLAENAGCKTMFVEEIMGHANSGQRGEGSRYMKQVFVENLKATVDMVPVPFDPFELRRPAEDYEASCKGS